MYKKDLHEPHNHDGVITHLELSYLKCEVKWALGSITMNKASRDDGIPVELFQNLKDDAVKVLHSISQKIWKKSAVATGLKRSVFIPIQRKAVPKNIQTTAQTTTLSSHTSKVMLKIFHARLQQYMNHELPYFQVGFRKSRGTRDQTANICWIIEKVREFQKNHLLLLWLCQSLWMCGSQQTVENSERDGNTRPPYLPPEKSVCRSRSSSQNWTWNNRLLPNWERSTTRLYIVTLLI